MRWLLKPDKLSIKPVYQQIRENVVSAVKEGTLKIGESLPSINKICNEYRLAPGTVIRAYEELKSIGIVSSKQGKGYYIAGTAAEEKIRIFLLFDRMNTYKEILYDSFLNNLADDSEVTVFFHHYDVKRFEKIVRENLGKFSHYVIMPHFNTDVSKVITRIPDKNLVLIDNLPPLPLKISNAVYQDFENDIFNGLGAAIEKIRKYKKIWLSLSQSRFQFVPNACINGFKRFCNHFRLKFEITSNLSNGMLAKNELYIVFSDTELLQFIKFTIANNWKPGADTGIISYDDTPVKEILSGGISVLSTDFKQMGKTAAEMISGEKTGLCANPFFLIDRGSF
jgi:DNA-binding transcriptional regulator YhcF (GntR family)